MRSDVRKVVLATGLLSSLFVWQACSGNSGGTLSGPSDSGASSESSPQRVCVPGQQIACACPGAAVMGAQACNADGERFGTCNGCPMDASSTSSDGAADAVDMDASGGSSDAKADQDATAVAETGASVPPFDGTSGLPCTTSADCKGAGGPGINVCSNSLTYSANSMVVNALPTPVCMVPPVGGTAGNCDPAPATDPSAQLPHFCDGPDSPTSPGICVATSSSQPHAGSCLPMCTFALDGSRPSGCVGKDTCVETQFIALDSNNHLFGWGFCQGTCQNNSDCSALGAGYVCQTDIGFCTMSPVTRPKQLGQACTANDSVSGACNCFPGATGSGYCTSACIYGGQACPMGWMCDTLQSASVTIGGNVHSVAAENSGMSGLCVAPCKATDAGQQCPSGSTCKAGSPIGPDCLP